MSSIIKRRIEALESKQSPDPSQAKKLIATALEVPSDQALNGTHSVKGNCITFYAATMLDAYKLRCTWLDAQQSNLVAMVCPARDSGDKVLDVLKAKHDE